MRVLERCGPGRGEFLVGGVGFIVRLRDSAVVFFRAEYDMSFFFFAANVRCATSRIVLERI